MAWQLIYTSAQRTLTPGQCGYGTVARSADLREALVQRLEQLSYYDVPPNAAQAGACPVVHACRVLDLRGSKYHVLSRIVDARLDFTHRNNHLAHHLVFAPGDLADLPSPATLLRHWNGWKDQWSEEPRFLDASDWGNLHQLPIHVPLPASSWARWTGDAGRAASLVEATTPSGIPFLVPPEQETDLLDLFAESLQLLDAEHRSPGRRWEITFTTHLQNRDNPVDFHWRGCHAESGPHPSSRSPSTGTVLSLANLPLPETPRTALARRGYVVPHGPASPATGTPLRPAPSHAAASPLKLQRSRTDDALSAPKDPSPDAPDAPANPVPPTIPAASDAPGRRVLVPLAGVLALGVVLLGGFYQPGWFLDRRTSTRLPGPATAASPPASLPNLPDGPPVVAHPAPSEPALLASPGLPAITRPDPALDHRTVLDTAFDPITTYLVHSRNEQDSVELGPIPELEALLRRVFGTGQDLEKEQIRVRAQTGDIRLAIAPSTPERHPEIDRFGGRKMAVTAPGAPGPVASVDCTAWIQDPLRPVLLGGFRASDRGLTLVFEPVAGGPLFEPFRLLMLTGQPAKPIQLPKSLLRPEPPSLEAALDPELRARLPRLPGSTGSSARFQLRPWVGSPPADLFEPFQADYRPEEGSELALNLHRQKVQALVDECIRKQEANQAGIARFQADVEGTMAKDLPLGTLLGIPKSNPVNSLASLGAFARQRGVRDFPDAREFVEYLRALFAHLGIPARDLLGPPQVPADKEMAQIHGRLATVLKGKTEILAAIPTSYFTNRFHQFGTVELWREFRREGQVLSNRVVRLQSLLDRIPPTLAATPRISLHVVDAKGGRLFELIRFTDSTPEGAP
jgi:hypothetical protein